MGCSESILLNFEFEPSSDPLEAESVVSLSTLRFFDGLFVLKMGSFGVKVGHMTHILSINISKTT